MGGGGRGGQGGRASKSSSAVNVVEEEGSAMVLTSTRISLGAGKTDGRTEEDRFRQKQ